MGTNFYFHKTLPCDKCGRSDEPIHIGKSSAGWCFLLHVIPENGINDLADWLTLFAENPSGKIVDDDGGTWSVQPLVELITKRRNDISDAHDLRWYEENHAVHGPNGLTRSKIDGIHCVGHGVGTYDLIKGEFL